MKPVILPYQRGSQSAKLLSLHTGWLRMKQPTKRKPWNTMVINWGCSEPLNWDWVMVNRRAGLAGNKLTTFSLLEQAGVPTPEWTPTRTTAHKWLTDGERVFARKLLNSHSGKGIVNLFEGKDYPWILDEVPEAPLYVKYIQKSAEYRVHVVDQKVVCVQQKKRRKGMEPLNKYIRSWHNGYVFVKQGVDLPKETLDIATRAVAAVRLDFGAVDIIIGKKDNKPYVLEVNTAPGLDNGTAADYAAALEEMIHAEP